MSLNINPSIIDVEMATADYHMFWCDLPNDKDLLCCENNGGTETLLNGFFIMMHENAMRNPIPG